MALRKQCFACDRWFTGKCDVNFCPSCMAEFNEKSNTAASDTTERQATDEENGGYVRSDRSKV